MCNEDMQMIFEIVIKVLEVVRFLIPIVLIIFCTIDVFKIIVSKKEDEIKKLRKDVFMKIIYSVVIYLIPILVPFILGMFDKIFPMNYDDSWRSCWELVEENLENEKK